MGIHRPIGRIAREDAYREIPVEAITWLPEEQLVDPEYILAVSLALGITKVKVLTPKNYMLREWDNSLIVTGTEFYVSQNFNPSEIIHASHIDYQLAAQYVDNTRYSHLALRNPKTLEIPRTEIGNGNTLYAFTMEQGSGAPVLVIHTSAENKERIMSTISLPVIDVLSKSEGLALLEKATAVSDQRLAEVRLPQAKKQSKMDQIVKTAQLILLEGNEEPFPRHATLKQEFFTTELFETLTEGDILVIKGINIFDINLGKGTVVKELRPGEYIVRVGESTNTPYITTGNGLSSTTITTSEGEAFIRDCLSSGELYETGLPVFDMGGSHGSNKFLRIANTSELNLLTPQRMNEVTPLLLAYPNNFRFDHLKGKLFFIARDGNFYQEIEINWYTSAQLTRTPWVRVHHLLAENKINEEHDGGFRRVAREQIILLTPKDQRATDAFQSTAAFHEVLNPGVEDLIIHTTAELHMLPPGHTLFLLRWDTGIEGRLVTNPDFYGQASLHVLHGPAPRLRSGTHQDAEELA